MNDASVVLVSFDEVPPADGWLGPRERRALRRFELPERRAAWRAGRWAARLALAKLGGVDTTNVEILAAPDGAPEVWDGAVPARASLSISHRAGRAAALAAPRGFEVGCDLELVEPRCATFAADWFTPAERAAVDRAGRNEADFQITLIWAAKEAALKVVHQGLKLDTRLVEVSVAGDTFVADVGGTVVNGWWRRDGPFVIAAAAQEKKR